MTNSEKKRFVFAIVSTAPAAEVMLSTLCEQLEKSAGATFEARVLRAYGDLAKEMSSGEIHIAWTPPLVAVKLEREKAGVVALCSSRGGQTAFQSVLFTSADSKIRSLADLRGKSVAWVDPDSSAGYLYPRLKLAAEGFELEGFFSSESFRRTHEAVARAVLDGKADAGATYRSVTSGDDSGAHNAGWRDAGATDDQVHILATAGPIPSDAITLSAKLDKVDARLLTERFLSVSEAVPELLRALLNAERFVPAAKTHFNKLREMVEAAKGEI